MGRFLQETPAQFGIMRLAIWQNLPLNAFLALKTIVNSMDTPPPTHLFFNGVMRVSLRESWHFFVLWPFLGNLRRFLNMPDVGNRVRTYNAYFLHAKISLENRDLHLFLKC